MDEGSIAAPRAAAAPDAPERADASGSGGGGGRGGEGEAAPASHAAVGTGLDSTVVVRDASARSGDSERSVMKMTVKEGHGEIPAPGSTVEVKYTGFLPDGTVFDASSWRGTRGLRFSLGDAGVIAGWNVGISMMRVGEKATLHVPAPHAYGAKGQGPIPPNTDLRFDVSTCQIFAVLVAQ
jgi:hypothetical protein